MYTLIAIIMAVTPSLLLVRYYYKQDNRHPEPKALVIKIFLLGIIYTLPVYLLEHVVGRLNIFFSWSYLLYYFFEAFIVAGLCEEYIKLRIIKKYVYSSPHFNEVIDGIVYTVVASLGFACMENILFVMNGGWHIALARGFTAVPMHAVCSGMMGYYIGKAKFAKNKREEKYLINKGLWQAIFLHGLYDFLLFISPILGSVFSVFAVAVLLVTYLRLQERINLIKNNKSFEKGNI